MEPDARANQLYWESDKSVNQIADELELSKGMLYGMIRPLPADLPCPRCSAALEYANRTARERGLIACPACGLELDEERARRQRDEAAAPPREPISAPGPVASSEAPRKRAAILDRRRDPVMIGAGLLLIAAGLWLFRGLNRR